MADEAKERKNKKISRMTISEIDAKIADVRKSMGGDSSRYMEHLISRKEVLVAN
jgi:hypothetical protein